MTKEKFLEKWFIIEDETTTNETISLKKEMGDDIDKLINHYWSEVSGGNKISPNPVKEIMI